jgi:hypothetical protein
MTKRDDHPAATHRWAAEKFAGSFRDQCWHAVCANCRGVRARRWDRGRSSQLYRKADPDAAWGEGFACKPTNKEPT